MQRLFLQIQEKRVLSNDGYGYDYEIVMKQSISSLIQRFDFKLKSLVPVVRDFANSQ